MRESAVASGRGIDMAIRAYAGLFFLFLFVPIFVVVIFSFNAGNHVAELTGLSARWYKTAWTDPLVLRALRTSISIALVSGMLSVLLGTSSAIAMPGMPSWLRRTFLVLVNAAIVVPGIVLGLAVLIFVVTTTDWANSFINSTFPTADVRLGLGYHAVVVGHSVFGTAIVNLLVRTRLASLDPSLLEAASDLYATPLTRLRQVTIPLLYPAIGAGFLLAFTFSFDDFIIAFFTRGQEQTLPIFLFASIRRGVSPVVNATAASLLGFSMVMFVAAAWLMRRQANNRLEEIE